MFLAVLSKSSTRKLYNTLPRSLVNIWDPRSLGYITNNWSDINHKPGHHGKFDILDTNQEDSSFRHSTATSATVIERLLHCFARPGDVVYDCFGGAGTVPFLCEEYGIQCRSVELDNKHFTIMQERLLKSTSKNRDFASFAAKLMEIADELSSGTTDRLGSSLQGSTQDRGEEVGSGTETIGKVA
jgi:DNA modification methylase